MTEDEMREIGLRLEINSLRAMRDAVLALCDEADRERFEMKAGRVHAATQRWQIGYLSVDSVRRALGDFA